MFNPQVVTFMQYAKQCCLSDNDDSTSFGSKKFLGKNNLVTKNNGREKIRNPKKFMDQKDFLDLKDFALLLHLHYLISL